MRKNFLVEAWSTKFRMKTVEKLRPNRQPTMHALFPSHSNTALPQKARKQKILISLGNQDFTLFYFSSKWCHQESNRGHKDFQSFALPSELWHLGFACAKQKAKSRGIDREVQTSLPSVYQLHKSIGRRVWTFRVGLFSRVYFTLPTQVTPPLRQGSSTLVPAGLSRHRRG